MTEFVADLVAENDVDFDSDSIETVAYDREGKRLMVEFQSGGTYAYDDVEESTYLMLVEAPSLNRFWRSHISGTYTSNKDDFYVVDREVDVDEPVDYKPTEKWLTNPGGDNPILVEGDLDVVSLSVNGVSGPGFSIPVIKPSRFGVEYTVETDGAMPSGPFRPMYEAMSEADALVQFNNAITAMEKVTGWTIKTKIVSVTHYFD